MSLEESLEGGHDNVLEVTVPKNADRLLLSKIYQILKENPGDDSIFLVLQGENGNSKKFPVPFGTTKSEQLAEVLLELGCQVN